MSAPNGFSDDQLKRAVALYYDGDNAPTLTAKGAGEDAEEIIRIALENGVPLCDNAALAGLLSELELGDEIPEALYLAVAHIIAFAYKMRMMVMDGGMEGAIDGGMEYSENENPGPFRKP